MGHLICIYSLLFLLCGPARGQGLNRDLQQLFTLQHLGIAAAGLGLSGIAASFDQDLKGELEGCLLFEAPADFADDRAYFYGLGLDEEKPHPDMPGATSVTANEFYARSFFKRWRSALEAVENQGGV